MPIFAVYFLASVDYNFLLVQRECEIFVLISRVKIRKITKCVGSLFQ